MPVWPVLWEKPLTGVFEAAEKVSRYPWDGYVLFAGREVPGTRLPWTYAPVWLLATTPPVILAGALLSVVVPGGVCLMTRRRARSDPAVSLRRNERREGDTALLIGFWFAVLFPIAYVILRRSTLYDGLRHLLFIVPPFTALAAAGWTMALARARSGLKVGLYVIMALGLMEPWLFQLRNHPNQVVYFQPLVGGPAAAYARFDLDYWGNCLFQAVQHAGRLGRAAGQPVVISGARWRIMQLDARRVPQVLVTRPDRRQHDLRVTLLRGPRRWLLDVRERPDILGRSRRPTARPCAWSRRGRGSTTSVRVWNGLAFFLPCCPAQRSDPMRMDVPPGRQFPRGEVLTSEVKHSKTPRSARPWIASHAPDPPSHSHPWAQHWAHRPQHAPSVRR
jgi:hypothetical protein